MQARRRSKTGSRMPIMELDTAHRDDFETTAANADRNPIQPQVPRGVPDAAESDHNGVFTTLVTSDQDIVGLVAYSIYKQNKYDWLMAFSRQRGRMPNPDETQSYLHGESTPRRLATYRHLAEATLDGRGLEVPGSSSRPSGTVPARRPAPLDTASPARQPGRPLLIGLICAILVVIGLVWYFHGGPAPK